MTPLSTDLRSRLENAVKEARSVAEQGARQAVQALAVDRREPHGSMTPAEKALRRRLRAHGRQLGDTLRHDGVQTIARLVREVAYEHWHRMLFARFLAENHLLIERGSGVAITMEECQELARERDEDPWALAASFAQEMLPQIFRTDDPGLQVALPPETRQALQRLLADLPKPVFTEHDSLGWTYQFWQSAEKDTVNARVKSGEKITGETLPAVTQLFTEPYMVRFLLHNTIGAWHAGRALSEEEREGTESEAQLRSTLRLTAAGGYDFEYLRFVREPGAPDDGKPTGPWRPAAGTFEGWPEEPQDLRILDPCCGSGHFLVEAFHILMPLRMEAEALDAEEAARAVIGENLFGLELDARCTQIAAFNLALAAWKVAGAPIDLPPVRIACSGIGPQASRTEWLKLAEEAAAAGGMPGARDLFGSEDTLLTAGVRGGLEALYDLFEKAPDLGSLIDPKRVGRDTGQLDAFQADFDALEPLLDAILAREGAAEEEVERAVAAKGMAEAARIFVGPKIGYSLVATNVPYLQSGNQNSRLVSHLSSQFPEGQANLATAMVLRLTRFLRDGASIAVVSPQDWLYKDSYEAFRRKSLRRLLWTKLARLGPGAFETITGEVVNVSLLIAGKLPVASGQAFPVVDVQEVGSAKAKARELRTATVTWVEQSSQLDNPRSVIVTVAQPGNKRLMETVSFHNGICCGDRAQFARNWWEVDCSGESDWSYFQGTVPSTRDFGGLESVLLWEDGNGRYTEFVRARLGEDRVGTWVRGQQAWGNEGVLVSAMGDLPATRYLGQLFDENTVALIPQDGISVTTLWAFVSSPEYNVRVREMDQSLKVRGPLVRVPYDHARWATAAEQQWQHGLPEPYSDDPTQWLFHGHPAYAEPGFALHVAVGRLLGYRWPAELDPEMRLSDEARGLVQRSLELDARGFSDDDGIVSLSPVRGEPSAADRLRSVLAVACGSGWSAARERELLAAAASADHGTGERAADLDEWLRESFFEEHCKLFHNRPFIWHVWDGLKEGFNALVNYHRLAGPDGLGRRTLESLTFTYLGEWIERQRARREAGNEGADAQLAKALKLQTELQKILDGEPPYDLFIRWKPLDEQPLGWDPDINDGVVLNIRPFMKAEDLRYKGAGVLRRKPSSVRWTKDRGNDPQELRPRDQFPWFWGCEPNDDPRHRTDFGADTRDAAPAGEEFDGKRWNDLHYTRAAKEAARNTAPAGAER